MPKQTVEILVPGGKATPGPPLGPALGPLGLNLMQVVGQINEKTASFEGIDVPVKVIVDPQTKEFEIEVGTPPVSALVKRTLSINKGASNPGTEVVGNTPLSEVVRIAGMKADAMLSYDLKGRVKEVLGTCASMGVQVEGMHPREVQKAVDEGRFDELLKEE